VPVGTPGSVPDYYGVPTGRMDFVMGPGGRPVISGSSEQQGGPMVPSPGFEPVDPGQYGSNPWFGGRVPSLSGMAFDLPGGPMSTPGGPGPSGQPQSAGLGQGALGVYGSRSAAELQALLKMLSQLDFGSLVGGGDAGAQGKGGLRIAE
jgi:hypothetical protein